MGVEQEGDEEDEVLERIPVFLNAVDQKKVGAFVLQFPMESPQRFLYLYENATQMRVKPKVSLSLSLPLLPPCARNLPWQKF